MDAGFRIKRVRDTVRVGRSDRVIATYFRCDDVLGGFRHRQRFTGLAGAMVASYIMQKAADVARENNMNALISHRQK